MAAHAGEECGFILVQYCWSLQCVIAPKAGSAKSIPTSRGRTASARALELLASILTVSGGAASPQPPSTRTSEPKSSRPRRVCAVDTAFTNVTCSAPVNTAGYCPCAATLVMHENAFELVFSE